MSEGLEVKIVADKISAALFAKKKIDDILFKNLNIDFKNKIIRIYIKRNKDIWKEYCNQIFFRSLS